MGADAYQQAEYFVLTSIAFSTVVPALDSAWRLVGASESESPTAQRVASRRSPTPTTLVALGLFLQSLVFIFPEALFPLVWIAPFLILDGLVTLRGGQSLVHELLVLRANVVLRVAAAGLLCGLLWEFWNFWAAPKWVYDIPSFAWLKIFEMPALGYLGYIPFAWSIYHVVQLSHAMPKGFGYPSREGHAH